TGVSPTEEPLVVGLVLREQQRDVSFAVQEAVAQFGSSCDRATAASARHLFQERLRRTRAPGPRVAKPERRQNIESGGLWPAIDCTDLNQDVLGCVFGVLHKHVKIAVTVEYTGVQQLVFHVPTVALLARSDQIIIRKGRLR